MPGCRGPSPSGSCVVHHNPRTRQTLYVADFPNGGHRIRGVTASFATHVCRRARSPAWSTRSKAVSAQLALPLLISQRRRAAGRGPLSQPCAASAPISDGQPAAAQRPAASQRQRHWRRPQPRKGRRGRGWQPSRCNAVLHDATSIGRSQPIALFHFRVDIAELAESAQQAGRSP